MKKIKLRNKDIKKILKTSEFQKILNKRVKNEIRKMSQDEYDKAIKKTGSPDNFLEYITASVAEKLISILSSKILIGSSIATTGVILSGITVPINNKIISADDINWPDFDWKTVNWSSIEFHNFQFDGYDISKDILGETSFNFLSWVVEEVIDLA